MNSKNRVALFKQWSAVICTGQSMMLKANICLNQDIPGADPGLL